MNYKKKLLLAIAIPLAIIAILIGGIFIIGTRLDKAVAEANSLKSRFRYWVQAAESISSLRNDYRFAEPYLETVSHLLPERDELIGFPKEISDLGARNGVMVGVALGIESIDSVSGLRQTDISMTVRGDMAAVVAFLEAMEKGQYFIRLNDLDFVAEGGSYRIFLTGAVFSR